MQLASSNMVTATAVLLAVYSAAVVALVVRGALRTKSMDDYAVGSMAFSPLVVGLSLAASMMSAATFIINPGLIALFGVSGVISYGIALPIAALVSFVVLTKGFRKRGQAIKATTMAQWIGQRFDSPRYALFFAVLALLLVTFIVLICVGLTKVVSKALNVGELWVLIAVTAFIFGYMMFGGANSMVYTNAVQAMLMLIVAVAMITSGFEHFGDGLSGFLAKLRSIDPALATPTNPKSFLFRDYFEIIACQLVIGVAIVCQPHIITKSLFLKSDKDVNRYIAVSVIVSLIFFAVIIVGLYARIRFPDLTVDGHRLKTDGIVSAYVVKQFSVGLAVVIVLGLIAAGISTLEALIQSVSATITADILRPLRRKLGAVVDASSPKEVVINRAVIAGLGALSGYLSWRQLVHPDVSVAIFAQNGVYAYFAAAFVPVLFGTFIERVPKGAPMTASVLAIVVQFSVYYGRITSYMQTPVRNPGVAGAIAIVCAVLVAGLLVIVLRSRTRAA
ncbi:MAG: hypothetical protein KC503_16080 [Myxococcales bacterium]|nr:hypothetical protein [Myxococcales bacterium]